MTRKINDAGLALIKSFEGCRLTAYKPVAAEKYWTIGWGHYGADVYQGMTITQGQADNLLKADLIEYENYVNSPYFCPVTSKLNENQFSALVSFTYNCGCGSLQQLCKNRTVAQIAEHITAYNRGASGVLEGLTRRRKAELVLYNTPVKNSTSLTGKENEQVAQVEKRYNTLAEIPAFAQEAIKYMIDKKVIAEPTKMDLSYDMIRGMEFSYRMYKLKE